MKRCYSLIVIILIIGCLAGCGKKELTFAEPTIEFDKKGHITQTIVESFDKPYYSIEELKTEFENAVEKYSELGGEGEVSLTDLHMEDGDVFATLQYDSYISAREFADDDIFMGSINDAYDNGYSLDVTLKSVEDGSLIGKKELMDMSKNHIFIVSDSAVVKTCYKILYVSANIEPIDDNRARVSSDSAGLAYIVTK